MMKTIFLLTLAYLLPLLLWAQHYKIANGHVWNGTEFVVQDLYVLHGVFSAENCLPFDSVIDASGQFVIPPFGDFHTHSFDGDYGKAIDSQYIARGIFFAQELGNDPVGRQKLAAYFASPYTLDLKFANGCLTSNYGHPIMSYERMALGINWPKNDEERERLRQSRIYEGRTYHLIDEQEEVAPKMNVLLASQPDLVKVILWNTAEYARAAEIPLNNKGLNPALLPEIMQIAREHSLQVVAHIDTESDLTVALEAGIRRFAHAPYYGYGNDGTKYIAENYPRLTPATIALLQANAPVLINPTLYRTFLNLTWLPTAQQPTSEQKQLLRDFHRQLLSDLKNSGVRLMAGADFPGLDALDEVLYYESLGVFTNAELLNILIETSRAIFPERKVGRLTEGYEANFLILNDDPGVQLDRLKSIALRMKNGLILP